ncbi:MAG: hypothetical protein ACE5Z5_10910 [Candidatus Bathyarchaeia archaeon]
MTWRSIFRKLGERGALGESPEPFREQARRFSRLLERRGFLTKVHDYPFSSVVNFEDPELRRMLTQVGAPYDREKAEHYAFFSSTGSVEFHPPRVAYDRVTTMSGEVPVATMRRPMARGAWREEVRIPPGITVSDLHWHTEDALPATHVHVMGDADLVELARLIGELRNISKSFLHVASERR